MVYYSKGNDVTMWIIEYNSFLWDSVNKTIKVGRQLKDWWSGIYAKANVAEVHDLISVIFKPGIMFK
jgi:hypothetical protein